MVESGEGSNNFDSADVRIGKQRKEWWRVVKGAVIFTVQINFGQGDRERNGVEW